MIDKMTVLAVALGLCLFFGFWGFVYQGYTEDAGSTPLNTWPLGAALYGAAVLIGVWMVRVRWPGTPARRLVLVGLVFVLFALLAAALSLDAGQP
jgi:hypothetical protein